MNRRPITTVLAVCAVVLGLSITSPAEAQPPSWTAATALPAFADPSAGQAVPDPLGGALLFYTRNGLPTLSRIGPTGSLAAPVTVPAIQHLSNNTGTPGRVAFLANGAAIVTWTLTSYGTGYMAYLSPHGVFAAPVQLPSYFSNVAVRPGEVLTSEAGGGGITVESWTLTSAGKLTLHSGPTPAYTGNPLFNQSWLALDSAGSAVLVILGSTDNGNSEQVAEVFRTKAGAWQPQTVLSTGAPTVASVAFATAPGGRAIVTWVEDSFTVLSASSHTALHKPGQAFGAKVATGSVSSQYGAYILPAAAAGADGTLVLGTTTKVYTTGTSFQTVMSVRVVAPPATSLGGPHTVPANNTSIISSLGGGDGQAIAGFVVATYSTGSSSYPSSYKESQHTSAVIFSATGSPLSRTFGSSAGTYDGNGGEGCGCPTSPPPLSVTGVALDRNGLAVAVGQLTPGGPLKYAVRPAPPKPVITVVSKQVTAASGHVPVKLACAKAACNGTLKLTKPGANKPVTLATASYSIKAGKTAVVSTKLTSAGKTAFKNAAKHPVKVQAVASVTGGAAAAKTVTVS